MVSVHSMEMMEESLREMKEMCGIAGVLLRGEAPVGKLLISMMKALQHRGMDSAGVAIYNKTLVNTEEYILRTFAKDAMDATSISEAIAKAGGNIKNFQLNSINGNGFDRYFIKVEKDDLKEIVRRVNATGVSKVLSVGHCMEIIKDVCTVEEFNERFKVCGMEGTHGLGHVRFSTESKVDLFHAHPFQAFDYPDIAVVHNGQITNYYKMREKLERKGHLFETENDSELIVHYIADKLEQGLNLQQALQESVRDLDGPFSYIISTSEAIGVARDKLGLRPAIVLENEELFAVASEESALRTIGSSGVMYNLKPGEAVTWQK